MRLRPDITWWRGGEIAAILDAKYKPLADERFPNADAYQMLAYCQAFGINHGTLVYAHDALDEPRRHTLPRGLTIDVRAIDVQREPPDVLDQVEQLAADVVARAVA